MWPVNVDAAVLFILLFYEQMSLVRDTKTVSTACLLQLMYFWSSKEQFKIKSGREQQST